MATLGHELRRGQWLSCEPECTGLTEQLLARHPAIEKDWPFGELLGELPAKPSLHKKLEAITKDVGTHVHDLQLPFKHTLLTSLSDSAYAQEMQPPGGCQQRCGEHAGSKQDDASKHLEKLRGLQGVTGVTAQPCSPIQSKPRALMPQCGSMPKHGFQGSHHPWQGR